MMVTDPGGRNREGDFTGIPATFKSNEADFRYLLKQAVGNF